ncbi:MAG: DNA-binding response regulator [Bacteroidetes bacterium]|nr:MAG: DNA-binding response regulator [Bacteroidota bacterium]
MKNNKIRVLIVEDEFITIETLTLVLKEMNCVVSGDAMNAKDAIAILDKGETDLAILDINIKGDKDGIWIAQQIQEKYNIPFIFLTAFGDTMTVNRAIETSPYGYIVKPFTKVNVFTSVEVALNNFEKQKHTIDKIESNSSKSEISLGLRDSIFIRDDYMFVKLIINDILYIKSDKNYLEIHLANKMHLARGKMSDFMQNLQKEKFMQVHRSYIVNIEAVDLIGAGFLKIGNIDIPLGAKHKEELKKRIVMF